MLKRADDIPLPEKLPNSQGITHCLYEIANEESIKVAITTAESWHFALVAMMEVGTAFEREAMRPIYAQVTFVLNDLLSKKK